MDRRTYESPMDWEYQDSGPFDPTSPFTHAAKNGPHNVFGSPSKGFARPNPFASLGTPSKSQPPQTSSFTPQLPPRAAAPPFRNPAFTTPRKPFDELALSEASGAEDSPALTEVSDFPNDTPEVDHMSDVNMGGTTTPSRVDKSFRYGKSPFPSKKAAPGRGEIRANRDFSVTDLVRKRKRRNLDKDVGSVVRHQNQGWEDSDADSDDSFAPRQNRSRSKKKKAPQGFFGSLFHMLDEHPNAPDNLYRWIQLLVNFFLVFIFAYIGWSIVDTVRSDIRHANESARLELMSKMTECQNQYTMNECSKKDRPALKAICDEWYDCMMQNPESIMRVKVTAKQIAEIINEFSEAMNLKAWGFFFAILVVCAFANNLTLGRYSGGAKAAPAVPSQPANAGHDIGLPPDSTPGFMWVPVQTPRMQRHKMLDDGTDTDSSPPKMKHILAAPYTPSGRRSPSKGERSRSPVKPEAQYGFSRALSYHPETPQKHPRDTPRQTPLHSNWTMALFAATGTSSDAAQSLDAGWSYDALRAFGMKTRAGGAGYPYRLGVSEELGPRPSLTDLMESTDAAPFIIQSLHLSRPHGSRLKARARPKAIEKLAASPSPSPSRPPSCAQATDLDDLDAPWPFFDNYNVYSNYGSTHNTFHRIAPSSRNPSTGFPPQHVSLRRFDETPTSIYFPAHALKSRWRPSSSRKPRLGLEAMDEDSGETPSAPKQPSPRHNSQGTSTSQSQGNPTPTSAQSSGNTPSNASGSAIKPQHSKRRRGLGVVTPNACTECRKKRAKCDGLNPCSRCKTQKEVECVYEIPVRQSKENLRSEIDNLRFRQRSTDNVIAALVRPDLWEEVINRLRGGQTVEIISDWLRNSLSSAPSVMPAFPQRSDMMSNAAPIAVFGGGGLGGSLANMNLGINTVSAQQSGMRPDMGQSSPWHFSTQSQADSTRSSSHPDAMSWTADVRGPPQSRVGSWAESLLPEQMTDGIPRFRGLEQVLSPLTEPEMRAPSSTWTNITNDINLVQHILALYFCWEYPTFASLSKEHFLKDFQEGRHRYCSPILINALLALGCRFSTQPMTRANPVDPYTSGDHFFKESQRLFSQEMDHHSLTTIQALGIMSIREASCGRDSESWYYAGQSIRLAVEMGLHRIQDEGDEAELAVQSATFWGAFALDHAWSLATGSLPQCSCFPHLPPKPAIIGDIEASLWVPYTDDGKFEVRNQATTGLGLMREGAPLQRSCEQPSNVRSVYKCFCELSVLVHQSLYILHSPGKPLTARDLLSIYTQYLNWYDQIPEVLRLGHNFTPAVLFAHMYYHFAILLLFRPLIKLRIIGSKVSPRDVCSQAADAIQSLLKSYSQLYTLRRTPSFVPYFVLTSAIMHLAIGASKLQSTPGVSTTSEKMEKAAQIDPHVKESISQGIADLTEMAPCHHFAEQALNILRYLAQKWNIEVEVDGDKVTPEEYDRLVKPHTGSLNFFAPAVREADFMCYWGTGQNTVGAGQNAVLAEAPPVVQKTADTMENPLFWPFPMQGRPILPSGVNLEQAGFAIISEY
ncbi:hypothetical protein G7046_g3690 [Stylonectria norvegica]|nr:hypothetical protein G7046_g3690 [Stylonectria norvegica]